MRHIDDAERRARLGRRHRLATPAASIEEAADAMVGLHSSDPVSVYLAAQARVAGLTPDEVAAALYERRTLLRILCMRRTLFTVTRDTAGVVDAACTRALLVPEQRRLARMVEDQGIATDGLAWVTEVCDATAAALEVRGEAVARELRGDVPELQKKIRFGEGKSWGGEVGISTRILFLLATAGRIIRGRPLGTWISSQYRWAPFEVWLGGPLPEWEETAARSELLGRWLRSFGPGTMTDLKWWSGWSLRDTKAALAALDVVEVELDGGTGFVLADDVAVEEPPEPWAALLPALDPTPMAWKEREWFLSGHGADIFDRNGNIGPTVWCNGRIVGGWVQTEDGAIALEMLEPVSSRERALVEAQRRELTAWLGESRFTPRFRTPLDRRLTSG